MSKSPYPLKTLPEITGSAGLLTDGDWVESKDQDPSGGVRLTQLADVGDGIFRDRSDRWMNDEQAKRLNVTYLQAGDVLIARMPDPLGRACVCPSLSTPAVTVVDVCIARAPEHNPNWIMFVLNAPQARSEIASFQAGSTRKRISKKNLSTIPLPMPARREQDRIAAEIEKQFTRLDAAVATLKRVQANLERARASVLKAAVEGRLVPTEAELARAEGRVYEPASVLLERILEERKRKHDEAQAGAKRKAKYKPPVAPDVGGLPELPEGWTWATLDTLADVTGGVTKNKQHAQGRTVHYLRVANVQRGYLDLRDVRSLLASEEKIERLRLEHGDILLNEGGDRDKLGRGWVWEGQIEECIHQNHVFRARLFCSSMPAKYVSHYANSVGQSYFVGTGKQTTNLASISLTNIKKLPVAIPPLAEQGRILAEVEAQLSVLNTLQTVTTKSLHRCERLRQSILKRAFEGKLVPQDPTDEPASELIARMKAQTA